jgi:hypothetical protein
MDKNDQAIYIIETINSCIKPIQLMACNSLIANFSLINSNESIVGLLTAIKDKKMEELNEF